MSQTLKIFQQTFWQVLGKVVTSLSTFMILGLVARNYGTGGTGVFTLALTYLSIFYILADFGFNAHVLRKIKDQGSKIKTEWNELLGTRLLWSGMLVILAVGLLPFWPFATKDFNTAVFLGSLAIIASSVFVTANLIFQGKLRYDLSVSASSFGTLVSLAAFVLISNFKSPIPFLLIAHLIGWLVIAATALLLVRRFLRVITPIFNLQYSLNLFKQTWPMAATLSLNVLYFRADSFLIAYFKPISDVGIYNVAYSVFQSALVLPTFIMNAYYPLMLKTFHGIKWMLLGLLAVSLLATAITFFFAPVVVEILTGGGFTGSISSLQILSLGFPAYFVSALLMWILIATGRYKSMLLLYISGLILNLILNFIFIPSYSFIAASWITVVSEYFILGMQIVVLIIERKKDQL